MLSTISLEIRGRVQGVYFRQNTRARALELGITGFVQNQQDQSVFITASGNRKNLDQFTAWCRKGPAAAIVAEIVITELPLTIFTGFVIRK